MGNAIKKGSGDAFLIQKFNKTNIRKLTFYRNRKMTTNT